MSAYPSFPELTRAPLLKVKETYDDPTIRDKMENGAVATRARYGRSRRTLTIPYGLLIATDRRALRDFQKKVGVGSLPFHWTDARDPANPEVLLVRFGKALEFEDDQPGGQVKRWKTTVELVEM